MSAQDKINAAAGAVGEQKRGLISEIDSPRTRSAIARIHPGALALHESARDAFAGRIARIAYTTCTKNPALLRCTPQSIVAGVVEAAQLGLTVDGVLGHAYLVPYKEKAQLQIGYRGFTALAYRGDKLDRFEADVVYSDDVFDFEQGTSPFLRHRKSMTAMRGDFAGAYAVAHIRGAAHAMFRVMTAHEIIGTRERSSGWRAFQSGAIKSTPWDSDFDAMAMKTPMRMLAKWLPLDDLQRVAARDEQRDQGLTSGPSTIEEVEGEVIDTEGEASNG